MSPAVPWGAWVGAGSVLGISALLLCRPALRLLRLALRACLSLGLLELLAQAGQSFGICLLGVNWVNALVLAVLGAPGFGLLLMLRYILR